MSTTYELTGRIHAIKDTQTFASGFSKREFVIDDQADKYPQQIKFEVTKDGCTKMDAYAVGDVVTVAFNLRGNEFNGKYYVSLQAWRVTGEGSGGQRQQPPQDAHNKAKADAYQPQGDDREEDIPF
jgi:hypothetical protein